MFGASSTVNILYMENSHITSISTTAFSGLSLTAYIYLNSQYSYTYFIYIYHNTFDLTILHTRSPTIHMIICLPKLDYSYKYYYNYTYN